MRREVKCLHCEAPYVCLSQLSSFQAITCFSLIIKTKKCDTTQLIFFLFCFCFVCCLRHIIFTMFMRLFSYCNDSQPVMDPSMQVETHSCRSALFHVQTLKTLYIRFYLQSHDSGIERKIAAYRIAFLINYQTILDNLFCVHFEHSFLAIYIILICLFRYNLTKEIHRYTGSLRLPIFVAD